MERNQPYLESNITLRQLAELIDLRPNQLSQLLNDGFKMNFSEYMNSHRLTHFKALLAEPKNRQLTIIALAHDSGFNSKTVFYTYFKKSLI